MADKYLKDNGSSLQEVEALVVSHGVSDAGKIVATSSDGKLDPSVYVAGSELNIDGGTPTSIYVPALRVDGGTP